jgi:predicted dehydrogenase
MNRKPHDSTRRDFLQRSGLTAAGFAAGGLACGGFTATAAGYARNETITLGVIGAGGRATGLLGKLLKLPGVKVVAICDVFDRHLARAKKMIQDAAETTGTKDVFTTKKHEELLAQKIDAVLIGTPDHWHVPHTVAACEAGKDVYVEKPLTHSLEEGAIVIKAQNDHKRIIQVGTQQRSMPHIQKAREIVASGKLGTIHKVHMTWNRNQTPIRKYVPDYKESEVDWKRFLGNAKDQPFEPYRFIGNWRWFWDFGNGILTDLMVHWQDTVNYLLDLPMPDSATSIGENFGSAGVWETPDTIQTLLTYKGKKLQLHFEGTFVNANTRAHLLLMGTAGNLYLDRGRCEVTPERGGFEPMKFGEGTSERGADFDANVDGDTFHLSDWLAACRSRNKPSVPAEAGVLSAAAAHMGNIAFRENRVVTAKG